MSAQLLTVDFMPTLVERGLEVAQFCLSFAEAFRTWPKSHPNLAELSPHSVEVARCSLELNLTLVEATPPLVEIPPLLVEVSPTSIEVSRSMAEVRPTLAEPAPTLVDFIPELMYSTPLLQGKPGRRGAKPIGRSGWGGAWTKERAGTRFWPTPGQVLPRPGHGRSR